MGFLIKIYDQFSIFLGKSKSLLKDLFSLLFIRVYLLIILILNIFLWYGASFLYRKINQDIAILHYNIDFGIDLIGNKNYFFTIPLLSLIFALINSVVLIFLLKKPDFNFLAHFLFSFLILFNIFLVLSLYSFYLINF